MKHAERGPYFACIHDEKRGTCGDGGNHIAQKTEIEKWRQPARLIGIFPCAPHGWNRRYAHGNHRKQRRRIERVFMISLNWDNPRGETQQLARPARRCVWEFK
ncbi:hypothetical protein BC940DRAFT_294468 [Gongronella butleri]|nr:hypothetical protein BC940DRAFT_294468 [Gongronella butleri]